MNVASKCHGKKLFRTGIVAASFVLALAGLADTRPSQFRGKATIDFPFVAGTTQCPAGSYDFESDGMKITLRSKDPKGPTVIMLIVTRLGRHDRDAEPEFIFDKVGDQLKLSEIWPAKEDGYLVLVTPEGHEHRVIGGSNQHK